MKLSKKRSLGIDISDQWISLTEVDSNGTEITICDTVRCRVPENAIDNGNIVNPAILGKAIKKLKNKSKLHCDHIHLSLVTNPVISQIFEMPKVMPQNIGNYFHDEIKNYAKMPSGETTLDFCGLKAINNSAARRSLVYAADLSAVESLLTYLDHVGMKVETVQPCELAFARTYFTDTTMNNKQRVILAVFRHGQLSICVFKGYTLEIIRVKQVEKDNVFSEIEKVLNYYEFEVGRENEKWTLRFLDDNDAILTIDQIESLKATYGKIEVVYEQSCCLSRGLAMTSFSPAGFTYTINLLPKHLSKSRYNSKQVMVSANLAAVILVIMILGASWLAKVTQSVASQVVNKKQTIESNSLNSLFAKKIELEEQILAITEDVNNINNVIESTTYIKWSPVIAQIVKAVPKGAQLVSFYNDRERELVLEGLALSHEIAPEFIERLKASSDIESAEIISTQKNQSNNIISYAIRCWIKQGQGE